MAHLIEEVQLHGIAYRRGLRAGDSIIAINGEPILDEIDYQALTNRQKLTSWCAGRTERKKTCASSRPRTPLWACA